MLPQYHYSLPNTISLSKTRSTPDLIIFTFSSAASRLADSITAMFASVSPIIHFIKKERD